METLIGEYTKRIGYTILTEEKLNYIKKERIMLTKPKLHHIQDCLDTIINNEDLYDEALEAYKVFLRESDYKHVKGLADCLYKALHHAKSLTYTLK